MKKLSIFTIATFFTLAFSMSFMACGGEQEKSEEEIKDMLLDLEDGVMEVHDEVMPLINDLRKKANKLSAYLEEKGDELDEATRAEARQLIDRLESADESMFDWMDEWADYNRDELDTEAAKEYYANEQEKINRVADEMRSSLEDAEAYINEHGIGHDQRDDNEYE